MPALPENWLMHYTVTAQKSLFNGSMLVFLCICYNKKVRILIVLIVLLILFFINNNNKI